MKTAAADASADAKDEGAFKKGAFWARKGGVGRKIGAGGGKRATAPEGIAAGRQSRRRRRPYRTAAKREPRPPAPKRSPTPPAPRKKPPLKAPEDLGARLLPRDVAAKIMPTAPADKKGPNRSPAKQGGAPVSGDGGPTGAEHAGDGGPQRTPQGRRRAQGARTSRLQCNKKARGIGKRQQSVEECWGGSGNPSATTAKFLG